MTSPATLAAEGMAQAEAGADSRVVAIVDDVIRQAAESGQVFSANSVRSALPTVTSRGLIGARIRWAANRDLIRAVGFEPSSLPSTRGAYVRTWVGA